MKRGEWIVCERTNRWGAALRTAAARAAVTGETPPRLVEVRSLGELAARLAEFPGALALIEVSRGNVANVLPWLSLSRSQYSHARFAALMDRELLTPEVTNWADPVVDRGDVASAIFEAGAVDVVLSPRGLRSVLAIAKRHWAESAPSNPSIPGEQPIFEWAQNLLPWQRQ